RWQAVKVGQRNGVVDDFETAHAIPSLKTSTGQFDPLPRLRRFHRGIRHSLSARAIVKARHARTLLADGVNEFKGLVVAKCHQWVALARVARRAGHLPEF